MSEIARYVAARYALGWVNAEGIFECAQSLLDQGICTPAIATLATHGQTPVNLWYVHAKFEELLRETGLTQPAADEAVWIILRFNVRSIIESDSSPFDALHEICRDFVWPSGARRIMEEVHDFAALLGCYYHYEVDIASYEGITATQAHRENMERLDREARDLARAWNRKHTEPIHEAWTTRTVMDLVRAIDTDRAFDRLPVLADALEDAGCDNADILNHCRQPGEHVRGCWVVDLVLGKE
jgi:hypothetical protein